METIVLSIGNNIDSGVTSCMVIGNYLASYQLMNDCIAPVSSIAGTANPCVPIGSYKRPYYILIMLRFY